MDSIIGRSQFLGEASTLFTDERTANARAKVYSIFLSNNFNVIK